MSNQNGKGILFFTIFFILLLVVLGFVAMKYDESVKKNEEITNYFNNATNIIGEIQDSLSSIESEKMILEKISRNIELGSDSGDNKTKMLNSISDIGENIDFYKKKIEDLEAELKHKDIKITGLEKLLSNLKKSIALREITISQMETQIDSLQIVITGLEDDIKFEQAKVIAKDKIISSQKEFIDTIYYIVGSKKELKEKEIIETKGGILGLGKSVILSKKIPQEYFTPLNLNENNMIVLNNNYSKLEIVSSQDTSWYSIEKSEKLTYIKINDKDKFKTIKYFVIMVK